MRRFDIGIASYNNAKLLNEAILSILRTAKTDFRILVVDNCSTDPKVKETIERWKRDNGRIVPIYLDKNTGYAGAVNKILESATTEYVGYSDQDVIVRSVGWDEAASKLLDVYHEVGMVFPNGVNTIDRRGYKEIMWGVGCFWILNKANVHPVVGGFDTNIGHQNECDYCLRVRMAGWKCAALPTIQMTHRCSATANPSQQERINKGVQEFVNKWNRYFNGARFDYFSPQVTRWDDWPPNALYLEEYYKHRIPNLNKAPEVTRIDGAEYDLIKVPRRKGFYRERII